MHLRLDLKQLDGKGRKLYTSANWFLKSMEGKMVLFLLECFM